MLSFFLSPFFSYTFPVPFSKTPFCAAEHQRALSFSVTFQYCAEKVGRYIRYE